MLAESDVSCARILRVSLARVVVLCVHYLDGGGHTFECGCLPPSLMSHVPGGLVSVHHVSCRSSHSHHVGRPVSIHRVLCRSSHSHHVGRLMSVVSCLMSDVSCLMSVPRSMSDAPRSQSRAGTRFRPPPSEVAQRTLPAEVHSPAVTPGLV